MNEVTIVFLSYGHMCFTDFVPDPEIRSEVGLYYIAVASTNLLVHIGIMLFGSLFKLRSFCRKKFFMKKITQKANAASLRIEAKIMRE